MLLRILQTDTAGRVTLAGYRIDGAAANNWTWDAANNRGTLAVAGIGGVLE